MSNVPQPVDSGIALPIGASDIKVKFPPGRDPRLPDIYVTKNHPLHHGQGTAYYFIHDGTLEGARKLYNLEVNDLKIPQGSREEAIALGFLELEPGDAIFSRLKTAPADGTRDNAVLWVTGRELYSDAIQREALRSRDGALGPRELRTRDHARVDHTGKAVGGTTWERSLDGKFNEKRGRCYAFGCTYQRQRSLYSPCAAGKLSVADASTLKMRSDLAKITLEMAMLSFKQGPSAVVEAVRLNHQLLNTPRIGVDTNFAYTSNQLNLAHIRAPESTESLADNMGQKFGGAHIDQLDSPGHYTNMVALSDLPEGCDPGRFYIVYPGVFCTLNNFVSVNFSGLRVHGGSPPIAAEGTTEYEMTWAARCTVVGYAKIGPTSTEHKMPLLQVDPDAVLSVTPEMMRTGKFSLAKTVNATSFVIEGPTLMTPAGFMMFIVHCILFIILSILSKTPETMNVKLDTDAFLKAFSFTDGTGVRRRLGPWVNGPGWRRRGSNIIEPEFDLDVDDLEPQDNHVLRQWKIWEEHERICGGHIPSAVCCLKNIRPLEGWAEGDPLEKMKPLLFNKPKGNNTGQNNDEVAADNDEIDSSDEEPRPPAPPPKTKKTRKNKSKPAPPPNTKKTRKNKSKNKQKSTGASTALELGPESEEDDPVPTQRLLDAGISAPTIARSTSAPSQLPAPGNPRSTADSNDRSSSAHSNNTPVARGLRPRNAPLLIPEVVITRSSSQSKASSSITPSTAPSHDVSPSRRTCTSSPSRLIPEVVITRAATFSGSPSNALSIDASLSHLPPLIQSLLGADDPRTESTDCGIPSSSRCLSPVHPPVISSDIDVLSLAPSHVHPMEDVSPSLSLSSLFGERFEDAELTAVSNPSLHQQDSGDVHDGTLSPPCTRDASVDIQQQMERSDTMASARSSVSLGKRRMRSEENEQVDDMAVNTGEEIEVQSQHIRTVKRRHLESSGKEGDLHVEQTVDKASSTIVPLTETDVLWEDGRPKILSDIWEEQQNLRLQINIIECKLRDGIVPDNIAESHTYPEAPSDASDDRESADMPPQEERANIRELPLYLHGLTSEIVNRELRMVRKDVTALAIHHNTSTVAHAITALHAYQKTVQDVPLSPASASAIQHAWSGLEFVEISARRSSLRVRMLRASVMTINSSLWHWIQVTIPNTIAAIVFEETEVECDWLLDLMRTIRRCTIQHTDEVVFFPFQYGLLDVQPASAAVVNFRDLLVSGDEDDLAWIRLYVSVVNQILEVWLHYPTSGNSRWQGIFAINIIQTLGPEFLLLDVVWEKYQHAKRHTVTNTLLPEYLDVSRYPLLDRDSSLRKNVKHISELIEDYFSGRLYRYVSVSPEGGAKVQYASQALRTETEQRIICFKTFIQNSFRHVFRGDVIRNTRLQGLLTSNEDKYSPFREHAPTRYNMLAANGPFSASNVRTVAGFFSALVCRGVTFGTNFSRKGRTMFASPADFHQARLEGGFTNVSDYCDPGAYGQHNKDRNPTLVDLYWEKVHEDPWPGLNRVEQIEFEDMYEYLYPASGDRRFMQLGSLGSYLLTVDYAYAGLVAIPTHEQMARIILKLNKGPARALLYLGLVSAEDAEKSTARSMGKAYVNGFAMADKLLRESIPKDYHAEAGLDIFVVEHSLCKFGRCTSKCDLSV